MGGKINFNKFICALVGCRWLFNFTTLPTRAICERCNAKSNFNTTTMAWEKTNKFPPELGTDEEIKKRWFHHINY